MQLIRKIITVKGIVQGVGFRPFVYRIAHDLNLNGRVINNPDGVEIDLQGQEQQIGKFLQLLKNDHPPLAKIDKIVCQSAEPVGYNDFTIGHTERLGTAEALVSVDVAVCDECLAEMFDHGDRRYHYPFINCTNCGPRFTIIKDIPYDREFTTMSDFPMCEECSREYHNPLDRRFHAQPNACPVCGPRVSLYDNHGIQIEQDPIPETANLLNQGYIIAIKGLGGYHLACNALNNEAVSNLRKRKLREDKPFALMAKNIEQIKDYCIVSEKEKELLRSVARPIVLLKRREDIQIAGAVAPGNEYLGVMLPYTPIHYLLFEYLDFPLVMTSANVSDEPIAYQDSDAFKRLKIIADYFLTHNREIHHRCDDSVLRVYRDKEYFLRRSRGYAPAPVKLFENSVQILAVGGEQKNTFCLTKGYNVFVSHHIGDLENMETLSAFEREVEMYKKLFHVEPELVVHDNHPEYLSTKYSLGLPNIKKVGLQHHHAHIASCMAEYGLEGNVIGIAFDGTGYGDDGAIWGGEFLYASLLDFKRFAHLKYVPMPGGAKAIKEPWRMAAGYLYSQFNRDWSLASKKLTESKDEYVISTLTQVMEKKINSPLTSSMGRFFDAVSALIGIRDIVNYEGQAAVEMEQVANTSCNVRKKYNYKINNNSDVLEIDPGDALTEIINELKQNVTKSEIAMIFHNTIKGMVVDICEKGREMFGEKRVCLSGGVFQNLLLLNMVQSELETRGFEVFIHRIVPTNDGGLCLGQAAIAAAKYSQGLI